MTRARPNARVVGAALSDGEVTVLRCLLTGATSKEIAAHLGKHYRTVEVQRSSLLSKTGALSLAQLGYWAARQGFEPDATLRLEREPAKGPEQYRDKSRMVLPRVAGRTIGRDL